jgi:hypothetical protein
MPERGKSDWVWFFAVLFVLGAAAVTIPLYYNLSLQLKPQQVEEARALWRSAGPRDHDIDYQERQTHGPDTDEAAYRVMVRDGRVVVVFLDGRLSFLADTAAALALGPWPRALPGTSGARDIDGIFDHIEDQLRRDLNLSHRPYATATFDKRDGHPMRYVRRIRGGAERLEWTIKLMRVGEAAPEPGGKSR